MCQSKLSRIPLNVTHLFVENKIGHSGKDFTIRNEIRPSYSYTTRHTLEEYHHRMTPSDRKWMAGVPTSGLLRFGHFDVVGTRTQTFWKRRISRSVPTDRLAERGKCTQYGRTIFDNIFHLVTFSCSLAIRAREPWRQPVRCCLMRGYHFEETNAGFRTDQKATKKRTIHPVYRLRNQQKASAFANEKSAFVTSASLLLIHILSKLFTRKRLHSVQSRAA